MRFSLTIFIALYFIKVSFCADNRCSEYINVDKDLSNKIVRSHFFTLTGSGTMPGTGSGTMSPCTGSGSISGSIYTQFNEPIKSVHVELLSSQDNYPLITNIEIEGEYAFSPIENEFNYLISPTKDGDDFNGISTIDVLLLANLVFRPSFNASPYTYIAADVNQDQQLNIADVVDLLYLIIGKGDTLQESWVFVDANQQFIDESNPWPYLDMITVNQLDGASSGNDFIGIKVGDLSGNANPWLKVEAETRSQASTQIYTEDKYLSKDKIYTISFYSKELDDIKGLQLFFGHNGVDVLGIQSGILDAEQAAFHHTDQTLFASWYGITETKSAALFSMTIRVDRDGFLSDRIHNYKHWLSTEAYVGETLDVKPVEISFTKNNTTSAELTLGQNSPNPFLTQTEISYILSEEGQVVIDIYDDSGRLVLRKSQAGVFGNNTFVVNREVLNETGLYYYTVAFKGNLKTKAMLLID